MVELSQYACVGCVVLFEGWHHCMSQCIIAVVLVAISQLQDGLDVMCCLVGRNSANICLS